MSGQVPEKYAIIGSGRVARHFSHYFDQLHIAYESWSRDGDPLYNSLAIKHPELRLKCSIESADVVLLLVSDDAISGLVEQYPFLCSKTLVHFSGALQIEGIAACHPLMTFGPELYPLETYRSIPFVLDSGISFADLFPALDNTAVNIAPESRAYYHSLCVMAGNFAQTLWREVGLQFEQKLGIDQSVLFPYLRQNMLNFAADPASSATGPIARGDTGTIEKHLSVLKNTQLESIYKSFLDYSRQQSPQPQQEMTCEYT